MVTRDGGLKTYSGWQSGLRTVADKAKPSLASFELIPLIWLRRSVTRLFLSS